MNAKITLRARWVLPMDGPPLDGGYVTMAEGRIASVGRQQVPASSAEDLGDVVLMPGLVNAHTHLEFSQLEQPLGTAGIRLPEWIRLVIADRNRSGRDTAASISGGMRESLEQGVTTVAEIATASPAAYAAEMAPQLIAFQEVIGFSAARRASVLADVEQRLENCRGTVRLGISPHAPYSVHPQLFEELVDLAVEKNLPVAMHLAESQEEVQLLAGNSGPFRELLEEKSMWDNGAIPIGSRALTYLKILARAPRSLIIHGNYLVPEEFRLLAEHREKMAVVYCPRTHHYFGHKPYPLLQMLAAGVRFAIGTDSRASNPDLSLLDELRFVHRHFDEIPVEQVLQMGTIAGAAALGLEKTVGSITAGKEANLTAVACESNAIDPARAVLLSDSRPSRTWLRGKEVY